jgi:hypothetical protein
MHWSRPGDPGRGGGVGERHTSTHAPDGIIVLSGKAPSRPLTRNGKAEHGGGSEREQAGAAFIGAPGPSHPCGDAGLGPPPLRPFSGKKGRLGAPVRRTAAPAFQGTAATPGCPRATFAGHSPKLSAGVGGFHHSNRTRREKVPSEVKPNPARGGSILPGGPFSSSRGAGTRRQRSSRRSPPTFGPPLFGRPRQSEHGERAPDAVSEAPGDALLVVPRPPTSLTRDEPWTR